GNRRHIDEATKHDIVILAAQVGCLWTAQLLGIGRSTVFRIVRLAHSTGNVVRKPIIAGRPRLLNALDLAFLEGLVEHQPDMYLEEMQYELSEGWDIWVSIPTIERAL
ncbi:hypothetical protein K488DRAFT_7231, partial [Vararia minispora EC-137]